ncbi:MAG: tetratricopeptide repeat protein [Reichenbachiella sp.]
MTAIKSIYIVFFIQTIIVLSPGYTYAQEETVDEETYNNSKLHTSEGWDLVGLGELDQALKEFNMAIEFYNGDADSFVGRANVLMKLGRLDDAEKDVEQALLLAPNQSDMFYLAGNIYFKMKNYIKATNNYSNAIRYNDSSDIPVDLVNCYYNRGNAYFSSEMYRSAVNDFTKVIELKENYMQAYHNRALSYKNKKDFENACKDFYTAKELGSKMSDKFIEKYCQ